jgi:hypothetical protein
MEGNSPARQRFEISIGLTFESRAVSGIVRRNKLQPQVQRHEKSNPTYAKCI